MHNCPTCTSFWKLKVPVLSLAWHVQQSTVSSKRSKASTECSTAPSLQCTEQYPAEVLDTAEKLSDAADASQIAGCCNGHTMPKENRSPNLGFLDCFEAELDNYNETNQVPAAALRPSGATSNLVVHASHTTSNLCLLTSVHPSAGNQP